MNLFLDDQRKPSQVTWIDLPPVEWSIVRSYDAFVKEVRLCGLPIYVSFDHDLADEHYKEYFQTSGVFRYSQMREKTGFDCAKWLANYCATNRLPFPIHFVHSLNPIGRDNISSYIENFKMSYPIVTP